MVDWRLKELRGTQRRTFLRMMGAAAAGFAVERSKLLNYIADTSGHAMADTASCASTNRSIHIISGGGNFCLWQLLWPLPEVGADMSGNFSYHAPGQGVLYSGGDKPFYYGPESPFFDFATGTPTLPMTAYLAGTPVVHERVPLRSVMVDGIALGDGDSGSGTSLLGAVTAIQRSTVSLLPVIGVAPAGLGSAAGAPELAKVPSADSMVDLFSSQASKTILLAQEDKAMFETYYKAILGLRAASGRPTWIHQLETTKKAANLIGQNLGAQLQPQPADLAAYGVTALQAEAAGNLFGGAEGKARLLNMAKALITAKKAMAMGLTNSVVIGVPPETGAAGGFTDPHDTFNSATTIAQVTMSIKYFGIMLNAFYADCATSPDPSCTAKTLDKTVILTVHGDHPHNPLVRSAWPDATPGNSNWVYVMGNGYLPTGWHGQGKANNTAEGIDPTTGAVIPYDAAKAANSASAAILYAVAKGEMKAVKEYYKGADITALVKPPPA